MQITPEQARRIAGDLKSFVNSDAYGTVMEILREDYANVFFNSTAFEKEKREIAYLSRQALDDFASTITYLIAVSDAAITADLLDDEDNHI